MPKVMVIDDDAAIVELIELMLAIEGLKTTSVSKSPTAIDHIRREMPDLILLDLMMPEVDGWQILSTLKADATLQHIPVVVVTARVDALRDSDNDLLSCLAGHLIKPFEFDELVRTIKQVLDLKDAREVEIH